MRQLSRDEQINMLLEMQRTDGWQYIILPLLERKASKVLPAPKTMDQTIENIATSGAIHFSKYMISYINNLAPYHRGVSIASQAALLSEPVPQPKRVSWWRQIIRKLTA